MTDRIDLDDIEQQDEEREADQPNPGDWLWRGEGSPDDEPGAPERTVDIGADDFADADAATPRIPRENDDSPVGVPVDSGGAGGTAASSGDSPTGGVPPSEGDVEEDRAESADGADPEDSADAVDAADTADAADSTDAGDPADTADTADPADDADTADPADASSAPDADPSAAWSEAAHEHGDDPDASAPKPGAPETEGHSAPSSHSRGEEWENAQPVQQSESTPGAASHGSATTQTVDMTMAFSYRAMRRLDNVHAALADAENWTDYLGIVGDVDATVINKYQRDNVLDLDFFNGSGTGPAERLDAIGPNSMFYAERMVLVGVDEREHAWADEADWEFVPLETAAAEAEWELSEN